MLNPSLKTVQELLTRYRTVPVAASLLMDCRTPVGIFSALKNSCENCFLLESVERSEQWGRYSFLGFHPRAKITIRNGEAVYEENGGGKAEKILDPAACLAKILGRYRSPHLEGFPRFTGGLVGYFGYDLLRCLEPKLGPAPEDDLKMPDCELFLYDELVAFDHLSSRVYILQNIRAGSDPAAQYRACEKRAEEIRDEILAGPAPEPYADGENSGDLELHSSMTKEQFCKMVEKAKRYIRAGDIFQVVLPAGSKSGIRRMRSTHTGCSAQRTLRRTSITFRPTATGSWGLPPRCWSMSATGL